MAFGNSKHTRRSLVTNDFALTQPEPPVPRNILTEVEGVTIIYIIVRKIAFESMSHEKLIFKRKKS